MIIALSIAAFLVLCDFRLGFDSKNLPKLIFNFSKTDLWWLDFDLLPTFIGATILLVCAFLIVKREPRLEFKPARNKAITLIVLSVLTFAECSGRFIANLNASTGASVSPGITADIVYTILDIAVYSLSAVLLGNIIDLLSYEVSLNENTRRKELMSNAAPYALFYRTFCAFPVFIRIFMTIMIWDEAVLVSNITAAVYHLICIFSAVMFTLYVRKIKIARLA